MKHILLSFILLTASLTTQATDSNQFFEDSFKLYGMCYAAKHYNDVFPNDNLKASFVQSLNSVKTGICTEDIFFDFLENSPPVRAFQTNDPEYHHYIRGVQNFENKFLKGRMIKYGKRLTNFVFDCPKNDEGERRYILNFLIGDVYITNLHPSTATFSDLATELSKSGYFEEGHRFRFIYKGKKSELGAKISSLNMKSDDTLSVTIVAG